MYPTHYPFFWIQQLVPVIIFLVMIDLAIRGYGLWKAGRNNQVGWFVAMLVLNTMGIVPLLYVAFFQRDKNIKVIKQVKLVKTLRKKK